jgi:hypothetical protein
LRQDCCFGSCFCVATFLECFLSFIAVLRVLPLSLAVEFYFTAPENQRQPKTQDAAAAASQSATAVALCCCFLLLFGGL